MRSSALRPAVLAALLAAGSLPAAAAGEEAPAPVPREVRAGLLLPADAALAAEVSRGAALAAEFLSGPAGRVTVVERRVDGHWGSEASRVVELIYGEGVQGVVTGPDRAASHLAAQVTGKSHVPILCGSAASALTRIPLPWILQCAPAERRVLDALWTALPAEARSRPALVFHGGDREGERTAGEIAGALRRAGAPSPRLFPCRSGGEGRGPGIDAAAGEPDRRAPVVLSLPAGAAAAVLADLRAAGWRGRALGFPPEGADPAALAAALGAAGEGLLLARPFDPSAGEGAAFRKAWKARYGGEPGAAAAAAHDAVALLARAVRSSDGSPEAVLDALRNGGPLEGATGRITFDLHGEREGPVAVHEVRGGVLHPLDALQEKTERKP